MNRIILAYCHDNAELAESIEQQLSRIGIPFEHITDKPGEAPGGISSRLADTDDPVVLLVTANFLKSRDCMDGALPIVQTLLRNRRLLTVVADGKVSHDGGATFEYVETHFDRMVYALQYMNFWQTAWLDLSTQHQQAEGEAKTTLETELNATRNIANEIGELISVLRESGYVTWEQFETDDFAVFFRQFGLMEWHEQYRQLAAASYAQEIIPPLPQTAPAMALAETPVVTGPLAPLPAEEDADFFEEEKQGGNGHSTKADTWVHEKMDEPLSFVTPPTDERIETAEEEPAVEFPRVDMDFVETSFPDIDFLEEETQESHDAEAEIEQTIRDAWFWIEKGHTERGLELLRFTLEQHPENEHLKHEYETVLAKFAPPLQPQEPIDNNQDPALQNQQSPTDEAKSYDLMGDMAAEKGDYLFAKYCWDRVTEIEPGHPGIFRKLGLMTSEHLRDYRETAVHYLRKALEQDPNDADIHLALANAVLQNEDAAQAEAYYSQAVLLNPALRTPENDRVFHPAAAHVAEPAEKAPEPPPAEDEIALQPTPQPVVEKREVLTVLITGATSGIGRATAELFARHGHRVILTGRRVERLVLLKTEFEEEIHADVLMLPFDVREQGAVQAALDNLPESWQNIDILVNNAGLAKGLAPIHEGNIEHWEQMIDTNVKGLLYVTRAIAPGMVARRRGHIINIGSSAGKEVYANGNVYCATKFAVDALTRAMRLDLHAHNVRVSQVSPGHVEETEFAITRFDGDTERAKIYNDFQPLKSSDVAEAIYWMATRPPHVNVQDVQMYASQQASATMIDRSGR